MATLGYIVRSRLDYVRWLGWVVVEVVHAFNLSTQEAEAGRSL